MSDLFYRLLVAVIIIWTDCWHRFSKNFQAQTLKQTRDTRKTLNKKSLQKPDLSANLFYCNENWNCEDCKLKVTFQGKSVEYQLCKNWFFAKYQIQQTRNIPKSRILFGYLPNAPINRQRRTLTEQNVQKYMDGCTVWNYPAKYLGFAY